MKKNELTKIVNFFISHHRKSMEKVNVYYPLKHFPNSDLQAICKRLNNVCIDVKCRRIIEQQAFVTFDIDSTSEVIE